VTEIEDLDRLEAHISAHGTLDGVVIQGLDLCGREDVNQAFGRRTVLLGCVLDDAGLSRAQRVGAMIFPIPERLPFSPYRPALYTPEELMTGFVPGDPKSFLRDTVDARIYHHAQALRELDGPAPVMDTLAQRLHDHAIDDALDAVLREDGGRRVVAIMGGHAMERCTPEWIGVVHLARGLARAGYFVATGGGPGAMEAGNLGAWLAPYPDHALEEVQALLGSAPSYKDAGYLESAMALKERYPEGAHSLAIPTWFYGHEPSNLFATHVAKYFSNSLREDGLLAIATHGVIFAPGSAGTVQEVFMDACQNHYGTFKVISPMVFLGERYWSETLPVRPLLEALAGERKYADYLAFVDSPVEALDFVRAHPPV
jgi:predicted Rossmann-fold nucleotide-binding protein